VSADQSTNPKLLVFLHVALKQRAFQTELQNALPGLVVTTVGRVADLERSIKEGQDAVLTLPAVLAAQKLEAALQGLYKGSPVEPYSLVGADAAPDPAKIATVGALDILGREGMNALVQSLVGGTPRVERVTKVEDLLPLLQLQRVEAILIASRLLDELRASSRLTLGQKELPTKMGLAALAKTGAGGSQALEAVRKLSGGIIKTMGVDQWR
jgi:hypothetical protein